MAGQRKAFKDWFDADAAGAMAAQLAAVVPRFARKRFVKLATEGLDTLEFNGRVKRFSEAMAATLPSDIPEALAMVTASLPPPLPDCDSVTDGWLQWPVGQFIADYGLAHFDDSMAAMVALTQRFSSEFAVRPFVQHYPRQTFAFLHRLTGDDSPHVRRWCSEGVRPRLPWGKKLQFLIADPAPIMPIINALKDDGELYVRRSVANTLNDIAKDHPALAVRQCQQWSKGATPQRSWIIKNALRTLIKDGDSQALSVVGFGPPKQIKAELAATPAVVKIGGKTTLNATISTTARQRQQLIVDYAVHYVRKNGTASPKVFKWTTLELPARGQVELGKAHSLKVTTVRALYPGAHRVELQINGQRCAQTSFELN
ncbi:MAG: DNA alkylation repair protein [Gammaproteobacteria bacterium]|nr:DNA alkylation repair protein [Gammaproteobacteria bacterium]